jgi:hypothetical protein
MLHDALDGSYATTTMDSAIDLLSLLCIDYNLDPMKDILRHSDLTTEKAVPCPKGFFEEDDDPDDLWNTFKEWIRDRKKYYQGC